MKSWLLLLFLQVYTGRSFILDGGSCPSVCNCQSRYIRCTYKQLTSFPALEISSHQTYIEIYLNNNNLTVIPEHVIGNLTAAGVRTLKLDLHNNHIRSIHKAAFEEFGDIELTLDLSNNDLTYLPPALNTLHNLRSLNLLGNQIIFMETTVPAAIGNTLETLKLDMSKFAIWQPEISQLTHIRSLQVEHMKFTNIPDTAFDGLDTLYELAITNSQLYMIPNAVCTLTRLSKLMFTGNKNLWNRSEGILPTDCTYLQSIQTLDLAENDLTDVPLKLLSMFYQMTTLNLKSNNLSSFNSHLTHTSALVNLDLSYNEFGEIPQIVASLSTLRTLDMTHNHISNIGFEILSKLTRLRELHLSYNPISVIDPHAFSSANHLSTLYIQSTNLTAMPAAILHMSEYCRIYISNSPVQCSCDSLGFMMMIPRDRIKNRHMVISGGCEDTRDQISTYVLNYVPDCL